MRFYGAATVAASAVIGALRVSLGMNSAQLESGSKRAGKSLDGLSAKFRGIATAAAAGMAAAASAVSAAVVKVSAYADEMGKTAQAVGVSVESLSELRHSAEMSGATFEQLQTGLRKLSQTMGDALVTPTSESAQALKSLGVSLKNSDGSMKTSEQVLGDIADAYARTANNAMKTDNAMAIFGRSGTALIPMLNAGRDGLDQMAAEARSLGLIISEDTFRASEAFQDNLSRLRKVLQGVMIQVTAGVLPAFKQMSDSIVSGVTNSNALQGITNAMSRTFMILARAIEFVFEHLQDLYDLFKVFVLANLVHYTVAIAGSFITMAKAVRTAGVAMALVTTLTRAKITAVALLAAAVAKLTGTYESMVDWLKDLGASIEASLPDSIRENIEGISDRLKNLVNEIGGTDTEIAKQAKGYLYWANTAINSLDSVKKSAGGLKDALKDPWEGMRGPIDGATEAMKALRTSLGGFVSDMRSDLEAGEGFWKSFGSAAMKAIDRLVDALLNDVLDAMFKVNTAGSGGGFLGAIGSIVGGLFGGRSDPWAGLRVGSNAMGTSNWRGGLTTINERGGELVNLPGGTQIIPNHELKTLFGGSDVKVEVHNYSRSPARVEEGRGPNGEAIRRVIIDEVREGFGRGDFDPSMRGFNTRPARAKR